MPVKVNELQSAIVKDEIEELVTAGQAVSAPDSALTCAKSLRLIPLESGNVFVDNEHLMLNFAERVPTDLAGDISVDRPLLPEECAAALGLDLRRYSCVPGIKIRLHLLHEGEDIDASVCEPLFDLCVRSFDGGGCTESVMSILVRPV